MKNKDEIKKKIMEDDDFIYCPRLGNSVKKLLQKNPDGIDDERMSKVLLMSVGEVEKLYKSALEKIKQGIGIE
jgi:hypothetical protein